MKNKRSLDLPVRLPKALYAKLDELSQKTLAPKAAIIRRALEEYLAKREREQAKAARGKAQANR